jgi:peptide/nickel transport system substrate-binding protein
MDDDALDRGIGQNQFDLFTWGWVPFVDPTPSSATSRRHRPPRIRGGRLQRRQLVQSRVRQALRPQHTELDAAKRHDIVQKMLEIFYDDAPYAVLYKYDDLQAIRSDRWENFVASRRDGRCCSPTRRRPISNFAEGRCSDSSSSLDCGSPCVAAVLIIGGGCGSVLVARKLPTNANR